MMSGAWRDGRIRVKVNSGMGGGVENGCRCRMEQRERSGVVVCVAGRVWDVGRSGRGAGARDG